MDSRRDGHPSIRNDLPPHRTGSSQHNRPASIYAQTRAMNVSCHSSFVNNIAPRGSHPNGRRCPTKIAENLLHSHARDRHTRQVPGGEQFMVATWETTGLIE